MTNLRNLLSILVATVTLTVGGTTFETLTFAMTDGTSMTFTVDGLIITYDDYAHAVVTNCETTATIPLSNLDCMYFDNTSATVTGDVNGDGEVNIADINAVIDIILGGTTHSNADVNSDGEVNIADISAVIDIMLS